MKYKKGDTVKVIDRIKGHEFEIGTIGIITKAFADHYEVFDGNEVWYLQDEEIELTQTRNE